MIRIGWVGFHFEGIEAIKAVIEAGYKIYIIVNLDDEELKKRSGAGDYESIARAYQIPLLKVKNINSEAVANVLRELSLDIVFVIGWSQIIKPEILKIPKLGMIGAHASLLPHDKGSAPINWSLIRGAKKTGNTLIWLEEEVDSGLIIDQREIEITPYDTCATLYKKVAETNKEMILNCLSKLSNREKLGTPQPKINEPILPRRRPTDGLINWDQRSYEVYNFVRALTRPYPGAFSYLDGKKYIIWKSFVLMGLEYESRFQPGEIIGPVYSSEEEACGQLVACGSGYLGILEIEDINGNVYNGQKLSNFNWGGKVFKNE